MNALAEFFAETQIENQFTASSRFVVLVGPYAASHTMLEFAARLAIRSPLKVLDGGNRFNAYIVARALRALNQRNLSQILERIQVARAFTCYQVAALIESTMPQKIPTLVIDMLDTFYDESAPLAERIRLAQRCVTHLQRLSHVASIIVSLRPPPPSENDPTGLQEIVQGAADLLHFQEMLPPATTPRLF